MNLSTANACDYTLYAKRYRWTTFSQLVSCFKAFLSYCLFPFYKSILEGVVPVPEERDCFRIRERGRLKFKKRRIAVFFVRAERRYPGNFADRLRGGGGLPPLGDVGP